LEAGQISLWETDFSGVKTGLEKLAVGIGGKDYMAFVFDNTV
jgi:hypothetical protein